MKEGEEGEEKTRTSGVGELEWMFSCEVWPDGDGDRDGWGRWLLPWMK